MLIRFTIDNVLSFGESKEFNMLPYGRLRKLDHHKMDFTGISVLKLAAIYGANAAGKSNLLKGLSFLQKIVRSGKISPGLSNAVYKFGEENQEKPQTLGVEFIQDEVAYFYAIQVLDGKVLAEELYQSGLGKSEDVLLFERTTDVEQNTEIQFSSEFEKSEGSSLFKSIIINDFVSSREPVFTLLAKRENEFLQPVRRAFTWFQQLTILSPETSALQLVHHVDSDPEFRDFAEDLLNSFNIGISTLKVERTELNDYFGQNDKETMDALVERLEKSPDLRIDLGSTTSRGRVILSKEDGKVWVKQLKVGHQSGQEERLFDLEAESDGTVRLLDFVPMIQEVINERRVFVIDELERSLHPLLAKKLIEKFSHDPDTKGQLIFTTHESQLLDQEIFRQDEIWFVEKDPRGSTDLYSLSDYKQQHPTTDIQKGYLNGRYGAVPFLGNLADLNWHHS